MLLHRASTGVLALLVGLGTTGCITFAGDRLSDIDPQAPDDPPFVEQTVGAFSHHLDGGKLVTSNKFGREVNDEILGRWRRDGFITGQSYVKSSAFSGNADYNLTLHGHGEGESSVVLQFISGFTLLLLPYYVNQDFDLRYTLQHVQSGREFHADAHDRLTTIVGLLMLPLSPFMQGGRKRTYDRLADHLFQELDDQNAFDPRLWPEVPRDPEERGDDDALEPTPQREENSPIQVTPADRLRQLEHLRDEGLITQGEYDQKRKEILEGL